MRRSVAGRKAWALTAAASLPYAFNTIAKAVSQWLTSVWGASITSWSSEFGTNLKMQVANHSTPKSAPIIVRRLGVPIAAEITGVDIRTSLDAETVEAIRLAHAEYGVLVFPKQKISSDDLRRFGGYFGKLTVHPFSTSTKEEPELIVYDNKEGNPPLATDIWHSDETFRENPPMGTMLCCKIIPELGGDTAFCSMAAAYDGLSDRMQQFISGLEAVHDFKSFKQRFDTATEDGRRNLHKYEDLYPPVTHPVVRVHPVTGKKTLYVNRNFTLYIKGMSEVESQRLLEELFATVHTLEYQYRHRWDTDSIVFWDNRLVQHAAVHDYYPRRRLMERVTIRGDRPMGTGEIADPAQLWRRKLPWLMDLPDRQKQQHEL
jgi:taurine dioxygenase